MKVLLFTLVNVLLVGTLMVNCASTVAEDTYFIQNKKSELYLDLESYQQEDGLDIEQSYPYPDTRLDTENFTLKRCPSGYYVIQNSEASNYLTYQLGNYFAPWTGVVIAYTTKPCNYKSFQWEFTAVGEYYTIKNREYTGVWSIVDESVDIGYDVSLAEETQEDHQLFKLLPKSEVPPTE